MRLDLRDKRIRATIIRCHRKDQELYRLTIEYPREDEYRDRVMKALAELLEEPPHT